MTRLKRQPMGLRQSSVVRSQGHLQFVRGNVCCIAGKPGHDCAPGNSHAHHVQSYRAIEGGVGMKVGDDKVVPLCSTAHDEVHRIGQAAFEKKWSIDLESQAGKEWKNDSYHKARWELKQRGEENE